MTNPVDTLAEIVATACAEHTTYVADAAGSFPVGRAALGYVFDTYGTQYLDLSAGEGVMVLGHTDSSVVEGTYAQLHHHVHTARSGEHVTTAVTAYAKAISKTFPQVDGAPQQVLFCTTPKEARGHAMSLAQAVTVHVGLTTTTGILTNPRSSLFDIGDVETAALLVDLVLPDITPIEAPWVKMATEKAHAAGSLVIVDETVTGYGRTGALWAHQSYGIDPTITVLGGAGGGGLPFGAVVAPAALFASWRPPQRLFGASAVICQAGRITLERITPALLENATEVGHAFAEGIGQLVGQFGDLIVGQRGVGLLRGIVFTSESAAAWFHLQARGAGLLMRMPLGCVIPVTPPLTIPESEMARAVDLFAGVCLDWPGPL